MWQKMLQVGSGGGVDTNAYILPYSIARWVNTKSHSNGTAPIITTDGGIKQSSSNSSSQWGVRQTNLIDIDGFRYLHFKYNSSVGNCASSSNQCTISFFTSISSTWDSGLKCEYRLNDKSWPEFGQFGFVVNKHTTNELVLDLNGVTFSKSSISIGIKMQGGSDGYKFEKIYLSNEA